MYIEFLPSDFGRIFKHTVLLKEQNIKLLIEGNLLLELVFLIQLRAANGIGLV